MPALGWLLNLDFAGGTAPAVIPPEVAPTAAARGVATQLELRLYDTAGTLLAIITDWAEFSWSHRLNSIGGHELVGRDDPPAQAVADLFFDPGDNVKRDYIMELWRKIVTTDPSAPYLEYTGLNRYGERYVEADGMQRFRVGGVSPEHLLQRGVIAWPAGSNGAEKSGAAETVMKDFVYQNIGAGALAAAGRDRDHVFAGFTTAANTGTGESWSGARARRGLLTVLQEIGHGRGMRFRVEKDGSVGSWIFNARLAPYGDDLTTVGLSSGTGMNAAGFAPTIFALERGNLAVPSYATDARYEATVAIVLGQGEGEDRTVEIVISGTEIAATPWNEIEVARDARDTDVTLDLTARGDEILGDTPYRQTFSFTVLQVPSTIYGRDYWFADKVTVRFRGDERHLELTGVSGVSRAGQVENIQITIEEVPS